ncbi:MAG: hypothetical protein ACRDGH_08080, partial [Candidatus Limnocylindria bacterium]
MLSLGGAYSGKQIDGRPSRRVSRGASRHEEEPAKWELPAASADRFLNRVRRFDSCRGHWRLSCKSGLFAGILALFNG